MHKNLQQVNPGMDRRQQLWIAVLGFIVVAAAGVAMAANDHQPTGDVAVVPIEQTIGTSSGGLGAQSLTPDTFQDLLDQAARQDPTGYIFEINSGGGAVVASKRIADTVQDIEEPTACVLGDTAASSAYWIATSCDRIIADELTLTGSIGATSAYLEYSGLLEKLGIEYVNVTSGELKDLGSPYTNITAEERAVFNQMLESVEGAFVQQIADERNMSVSRVEELANGTIFLGQRAHELDLVDELGDREDALEYLEDQAGQNLTTTEVSQPASFNVLSLLARSAGYGVGTALSDTLRTPRAEQMRPRLSY